MLNGLILCLATQTTTWKKALLYISLYKQANLASLLSCLTLWSARLFFKVVTSTVTSKCSILTTRQRTVPDLRGGPGGHVPPLPEEAMSALKKKLKIKEKVAEGAQTGL